MGGGGGISPWVGVVSTGGQAGIMQVDRPLLAVT